MKFGNVDAAKWFLGSGVFVSVLFAVIQPEGTAAAPFAIRLLQWLLNVFVPLGILIAVHERMNGMTPLARFNPLLTLTLSGLAGSFLFSPVALGLDLVFGSVAQEGAAPVDGWLRAWLLELTGVSGPVTLVWLGMNVPAVLELNFGGSSEERSKPMPEDARAPVVEEEPTVEPGAEHNPFFSLLPEHIGRDIMWIKSELHYLRVVTRSGKALILFNLRDAIACLPDDAGVTPHRSYWVACRHVTRYVTTPGGAELCMSDGERIPVARRRRADIRRRFGF